MTEKAMKGGKVCVDCHGSHAIQRSLKGTSKDSGYCLACHGDELSMSFKDGEKQSLRVDLKICRCLSTASSTALTVISVFRSKNIRKGRSRVKGIM